MTAPAAGIRRTRPKNRRDVILQTAAELFGQRGYHAVGIDDIGQAVGITGPAVYRHFATKEDIVMAAIAQNLDRMHAAVTQIASEPGRGPAAELRSIVEAVVTSELDDWDFAVVWRREARGLPRERLAEFQPVRRTIIHLISDAARAANAALTGPDLRMRIEAQHGVLTGLLLFGTKSDSRRHQRLIAEVAARLLLLDEVPTVIPRARELLPASSWNRASRREVILGAGVELFAQRGYRAVGVDDTGNHAGITGPSVYRHFDNKEALLIEPMRRMGNLLAIAIGNVLSVEADPADRLGLLTGLVLDIAHTSPDLFVVYFTEYHHLGDDERAVYDQNLALVVDEWELLLRQARPELSASAARALVRGTLGACIGVTSARDLRQFDLRLPMRRLLGDVQVADEGQVA